MQPPKKILVRAPNWIGDHVMALPFYWDLKKTYPDAELTLLSLENVRGLGFEQVFDEHWLIPRSERHGLVSNLRWSRKIAAGDFDLAISLPASVSSALLFALAGVPHRVGFSDGHSDLLYTASLKWQGREGKKHKSELYRELIPFLVAHETSSEPIFEVGEPTGERTNLIVIAPGASIGLREWPYFKELLTKLRKAYWAFRIVVVGTEGESKWHGFLKQMNDPRIEDWVGKTNLPQLIEVCRKARLVVANDSGVAHLAATVAKAPTVVIFGPGDPSYIQPKGPAVKVVQSEGLPCNPCESAECDRDYGYQQCLRTIGPEQVMGEVETLLPLN